MTVAPPPVVAAQPPFVLLRTVPASRGPALHLMAETYDRFGSLNLAHVPLMGSVVA